MSIRRLYVAVPPKALLVNYSHSQPSNYAAAYYTYVYIVYLNQSNL
jgi:hypothetical protein